MKFFIIEQVFLLLSEKNNTSRTISFDAFGGRLTMQPFHHDVDDI
ncbi:hypothetical protein [Fortiea contorta]|nr:hypothetical protein [Fortiea contorta]